jgi:hypothetical protein
VSDKETAPWMKKAARTILNTWAPLIPSDEDVGETAQIIAKHAEECTTQAPTQPLVSALKELRRWDCFVNREILPPGMSPRENGKWVQWADIEKLLAATPQGTPTCNAYIGGPADAKCVLPAKHTGNCHAISAENAPQGTPTPPDERKLRQKRIALMGICCDGGPNGEKHSATCRFNTDAPQGTPPPTCFACNDVEHDGPCKDRAYYQAKVLREATPDRCPQCGSKDFWTVLPACHGGKAHKWHASVESQPKECK